MKNNHFITSFFLFHLFINHANTMHTTNDIDNNTSWTHTGFIYQQKGSYIIIGVYSVMYDPHTNKWKPFEEVYEI